MIFKMNWNLDLCTDNLELASRNDQIVVIANVKAVHYPQLNYVQTKQICKLLYNRSNLLMTLIVNRKLI